MFGLAPFAGAPFGDAGASNLPGGLTSTTATGAVGTLVNGGVSVAITGVGANGSAGDVVGTLSRGLTGVSARGEAGVFPTELFGTQANGFAGTVTANQTVALTGVIAQGLANNFAGLLAGQTAQGFVGGLAPSPSFQPTGVLAAGEVGSLGVGNRVIALTGATALGLAGNITFVYWREIDDSQTPNWQNISDVQSADWTVVQTD
jgi:hypothetical protein